ncbi:uncharacterized protein UV8b_04023 [Ustilaginoidea virens]|uniref:MIND kinetochore complex component Nnf1 n=1 Tax=Ustilaginoidea virens TaxID=1159556 RepID=A0A1B5KUX7_USTVR|nr:uncharacterized protein UV8b_04023 [Ustilaginoidea virens]QUC19782.1 hypothetical protein UV8b_04023 [Ustilaginoidea virens]GAO14790.1 hypothetical protein UVI_02005200 [Ustilaginoidea virens]
MALEPPPGPRATRLQQVYTASLTRTLDKLSYDNLSGCYPTIARRASPLLRQVQAQMVDKLRDKSDREFAGILRARDVVRKLNHLEGLIADAEGRRKEAEAEAEAAAVAADLAADVKPPHRLPPREILNAHLDARLAEHVALLDARLQTTQAQNALLADLVRQQRGEMSALLAGLERAVDDVRGANAVLGPAADRLAGEARRDAGLGG